MSDPVPGPSSSAGTGPHAGAAHAGFIDLHAHSTASDGARAPADIAPLAAAAGLSAFALTDHDTVDGLAAARSAAERFGIGFVAGIELSAVEKESETHVLGLHLSELAELERRLVDLKDMRIRRALKIVERLRTLHVALPMEAVLQQAAGGAVGRPHIARALIAAGFVADFREAFDRYLGNGRAAYVPKEHLSIADAIGLIHRAGGLAILAHPGGGCPRDRIAALAHLGLDGIEVLHPSHSWDDARRLDGYATEFKLVRSGGSDWHGGNDASRNLGAMRVPGQWLADQTARLAASGARQVA